MLRSTLYHTDLLTALHRMGHLADLSVFDGSRLSAVKTVAAFCGLDHTSPGVKSVLFTSPLKAPDQAELQASKELSTETPQHEPDESSENFWHVDSTYQATTEELNFSRLIPLEIAAAPILLQEDLSFSLDPLQGKELMPWTRLSHFLSKVLAKHHATRRPDWGKVVDLLAKVRPMARLPRAMRCARAPALQLLIDHRPALVPFWDDYANLVRRLKRERGVSRFRISYIRQDEGSPTGFLTSTGHGSEGGSGWKSLRLPSSDTAVLVLGDLAQYLPAFQHTAWLSLGRRLRNLGIQPKALVPCPRTRWSPHMARTWDMACWDRGERLPERGVGQRAQPGVADVLEPDLLFTLLAPAINVERGLLRDIRLMLSAAEVDVGAEYDVFQSEHTRGGVLGFTVNPERLRIARSRFADLPIERVVEVVSLVQRHHEHSSSVFGFWEVEALYDILSPEHWQELLDRGIFPSDILDQSRRFRCRMAHTLASQNETSALASFAARDLERLQDNGNVLSTSACQAIWALTHQNYTGLLPSFIDIRNTAWTDDSSTDEIHRITFGRDLHLDGPDTEHVIALLRSNSKHCIITLHYEKSSEQIRLAWGDALSGKVVMQSSFLEIASGGHSVRVSPKVDHNGHDAFFSFARVDSVVVLGIAWRLQIHGISCFLDPWYLFDEQRSRSQLKNLKSMVIFIGPGGLGQWQQQEIDAALEFQARSPRFPIVPVLLPGNSVPLDLFVQGTWIDCRNTSIDSVIPLIEAAVQGEASLLKPDLLSQPLPTEVGIAKPTSDPPIADQQLHGGKANQLSLSVNKHVPWWRKLGGGITQFGKLFSAQTDMGIDLGTSNTIIYVKDHGVVLREPSVVAVRSGSHEVIASGDDAKRMLGRTPGGITAIRPLRDGVIADFRSTEAMLRHFIIKVQGGRKMRGPRVVIAVPSGITKVEQQAAKGCAEQAGAREVYLIEKPMAAAIGVGLPVQEAAGNMIVDIGGGTTEMAIIAHSRIVYSRSVRVAGDEFEESIIIYMVRAYNLRIGERTAEEIKLRIGSAFPLGKETTMEVKGRDMVAGLPKTVTITSQEVREAMLEPLNAIIESVRMTLERCPRELSDDLVERGIVLSGGGALLRGVDRLLQEETALPVHMAEDPLNATIEGCGRVLNELDLLLKVSTTEV